MYVYCAEIVSNDSICDAVDFHIPASRWLPHASSTLHKLGGSVLAVQKCLHGSQTPSVWGDFQGSLARAHNCRLFYDSAKLPSLKSLFMAADPMRDVSSIHRRAPRVYFGPSAVLLRTNGTHGHLLKVVTVSIQLDRATCHVKLSSKNVVYIRWDCTPPSLLPAFRPAIRHVL